MNANGTAAATSGASFGRRRLGPRSSLLFLLSFAFGLLGPACTRSGTQEENQRAQAQPPPAAVDPALARAVGAALQPCIRAHKAPTSSVYTAQLRLERQPAGTAVAIFAGERTPGHEAFEACAVKAINGAAIAIPQTTTLPVAFDFGPER
jgi:hypothetical protein